MHRALLAIALLVSPALSACAVLSAPIVNPEGLPREAQTLQYVLDQACFRYMLGEASEVEAMRGLRLNHFGPGLSFMPPGPPHWLGSYPGLANLVVGRDSCSVHIHGRDVAAYRAATQRVLRRRFGPGVERDGGSGYKALVPGQITGCREGLRYSYYPEPRSSSRFSVDLNRIADCKTDPFLDIR